MVAELSLACTRNRQTGRREEKEREREPLMRKDEAESVREKSIREGERERKERD